MSTSLEMVCRGLFRLGEMPSPALLKQLNREGYVHWVNVCGLDLQRIYPGLVLDRFQLQTFFFADVFSQEPVVSDPLLVDRVDGELYESRTGEAEREQFLAAVQTLVADAHRLEPSYTFCYRGQGRSPAVVLAALGQLFRLPPLALLNTVRRLRPQAQLTRMSLSALIWSREHLG